MSHLKRQLDSSSTKLLPTEPVIFDLSLSQDEKRLSALLEQNPETRIIDTYDTQLKELFILNNPPLYMSPDRGEGDFQEHKSSLVADLPLWQQGKWVYFPWRNTLLHILNDDEFHQVRTGRNRNLITADEQKTFYNSTIGIAGLSVGNSCALAIVLTGGGKNLKLADPDTLELTNLNRIRSSIVELTEPKVNFTARQIYELDPYANITLYPEGITDDNVEEFVSDTDLIVEEIDSLKHKVLLRQQTAQRKVPLVMATDNGDGGILDIERYDLDSATKPFHGRVSEEILDQATKQPIALPELAKIITEDIVGANLVTQRMQQSLLAIGSTLPTWPQLGSAALLNGVAISVASRLILTGQDVNSDRTLLPTEAWLIPGYTDSEQVLARQKESEEFVAEFHQRLGL